MDNTIQDRLREQLHLLFPDAVDRSGKREVAINCPYCEREGRKDTGNHCYISLGYNNTPPLMYNCFRNINHKGIFTVMELEDISSRSQYLDYDLMKEISNFNKSSSYFNRYSLNKFKNLTIFNKIPKIGQNLENKISYINKRLGRDLSYYEICNNKIILSIKDFLQYNHINDYTRSDYTMDILDKHFIGFLTNTNGSIIMRKITDDIPNLPDSLNGRYIKYTIDNNISSGYYIIPSSTNLLSDHIEIHIAEGTFDILSIFYNMCNGDRNNKVYVSIGGNKYDNCMKYFISTMGVIDCIFHIYIDNDIKESTVGRLKYLFKPLGYKIYIHNNICEGEKDYGVTVDRIRDYVREI